MAPTLHSGDAVLVWRGWRGRPRIHPGAVVTAYFGDLLVVKRAARPMPGGWWVVGDNSYGSDDSAVYGAATVHGRVILRYWPRPTIRLGAPGVGGPARG
jgi:hypothetical protein